MIQIWFRSILIAVVIIHVTACTSDKFKPGPVPGKCETENISFSGVIVPILEQNCTNSCHTGAYVSGPLLETHAQVRNVAEDGTLLRVINHEGDNPMPPGYKISACNISKIKSWIDAGMEDN